MGWEWDGSYFQEIGQWYGSVGVELRIISSYLWETICFWRRGYVFGGGIVVFVWIISVGFHGLFKTGIY